MFIARGSKISQITQDNLKQGVSATEGEWDFKRGKSEKIKKNIWREMYWGRVAGASKEKKQKKNIDD